MQEVISYKCEKCGKVWSTKEECQRCESSHVNSLEEVYIGSLLYEELTPFPKELTLGFKRAGENDLWIYARYRVIEGTTLSERLNYSSSRFTRGSMYRRIKSLQ